METAHERMRGVALMHPKRATVEMAIIRDDPEVTFADIETFFPKIHRLAAWRDETLKLEDLALFSSEPDFRSAMALMMWGKRDPHADQLKQAVRVFEAASRLLVLVCLDHSECDFVRHSIVPRICKDLDANDQLLLALGVLQGSILSRLTYGSLRDLEHGEMELFRFRFARTVLSGLPPVRNPAGIALRDILNFLCHVSLEEGEYPKFVQDYIEVFKLLPALYTNLQ